MKRLAGKIAVITGGASGIGKAMATIFTQEGAGVHILDKAGEAARQLAETLRARGAQAWAHEVDLTHGPDVKAILDQIQGDTPFSILVCNAGVGMVGTLEETSEADLDRLFAVNVKGVFHSMQAAIPHFRTNGGGAILNVASIAATVALPARFAYSMTKGAVLSMTYTVAMDYRQENIRCNSISPARVHTQLVDTFVAKNYPGQEAEMMEKLAKSQPIGRMGTPEEIAHFAAFLVSDEAAFITGTDYPIDGGFIRLSAHT
ncbi:MAG: glucose 1-dehydrogenase [Bacteroidota bacterium]